MKKISIYLMAIGIATMLASCGGSKKAVTSNSIEGVNPFGTTYNSPCEIYDTPEDFAATGIFKGSSEQKGAVHMAALANAQQLVRTKMSHAYRGMVSDFMTSHGMNKGNDIDTKLTAAGDQIIDVIVNNTSESCVQFSGIDEKGFIECYVAIKIPKEDIAQKVASKVGNILTDDEKLKIDFEEDQFRKQMEDRFKNYKESH